MQEVNTDKSDAGQVGEPTAWMQKSGGNSSTKFESGDFPRGVGDGQGGLACCGSWGRKESDTTERLN